MLVSVIDGAVQAAVQSSRNGGGTVIVNPSASQDVMTEVLKGTVNIPPTVVKQTAIASRCWSRAIWISGRSMSFESVAADPLTDRRDAVRARADAARAAAAARESEVTELCINRPHEAFVETRDGWHREPLPFADFDWCRRFAKLVANSTQQRIDETSPLLSASLPSGERVQIVLPPATTRRLRGDHHPPPGGEVWTIEELAAARHFSRARAAPVDTPR